ncbi:MAG: alpha-glucosidase [Deltaproteobacteria bacterium]|uniref:Alpha-glucosidase n=1 Tax=Candidatus Zymogenus saltonus TaxID=2844893 RepID=A0A9D8KE03_9DELT|nr:alpha-glucosidase [Candidatus Zymogenus saltonus]
MSASKKGEAAKGSPKDSQKKSPKGSIWWREGVFYQIYPRSFKDTNGDGVGDLNGITDRLDYLNDGTENSLGIDAIWLSPINPSPMFDFGYDVSDYKDIDPAFGNLTDFKRLLKEAHKRGIRIVLDFVPNHTSHLHEWFLESRSSKDSPKRDWYIWQDRGSFRGGRPNNWQSVFGGPAWELDEKTGQFYYHHFLKEQPDLNWRNKKVRKAMYDQMRFWLDMGVDGFRLDVINHIFKDEKLRSNPYTIGIRPYDMQKHLYDKELPECVEVAREMRSVVDSYGKEGSGVERMLVGEVFSKDPVKAAEFYGNGMDRLNLVFNFDFFFNHFRAEAFREAISLWEDLLPDRAWPTYFLSNHDQPRHISRYGRGSEDEIVMRARVAATMLLTLKGTPFLYYGEEIGMRNLHIKKQDLQDPVGIRYWPVPVGRDMARTPMQWDDTVGVGFTQSSKPWLPINPNRSYINVKAELKNKDSLLSFYRNLIWKRKGTPSLTSGSIEILRGTPKGIFAYRRVKGDDSRLVLLNFKGCKRTIAQNIIGGEKEVRYSVDFSTHRAGGDDVKFPLEVWPYEATILR